MRESAAAHRAYQDYREQTPPRSLERLVEWYRSGPEAVPPTRRLTTLKEWSRHFGWAARVAAYDAEIAAVTDQKARAERLAEIERRRKQRLQVAAVVRGKGVEGLAALQPTDLARLPSAIVRLLDYADKTEMAALGEPDQRVELSGPDGRDLTFTIKLDRPSAADADV
jgi:hypothetical protein